jgi:thymidylate synthase (FAD)
MRDEVRKVAPLLFIKAGPTCETDDYCSEGKMTCGRLERLRDKVRLDSGVVFTPPES